MRILINTMHEDMHADAVSHVLTARGHCVDIVRNRDFPRQSRLTYAIGGERGELRIDTDGTSVDLWSACDVVWNRRDERPTPPTDLPEDDQPFVRQELLAAQAAMWAMTGRDALWINSVEGALRASHKPLQLALAVELGLAIPETLIGNDPRRVREFVAERGDGCIYKPFYSGQWEVNNRLLMVYTSVVRSADLPGDAMLQACPGIYQRLVRKRSEVRATFMGASHIAIEIDSQSTERGQVDWRQAQMGEPLPAKPIVLPDAVAARCRAMMARLGIVFGCFDFIIDEDGRYVFLEVNEAGQFLFLEVWCPELPVLDMFCEFVASADPAFVYRPSASPVRFAECMPANV